MEKMESSESIEKAIETVSEMITQRGYTITSHEDDKITGQLDDGTSIVVFTIPIIKFNVDRVKEYISYLHNMNINHCIIIYTNSVTSMAKKLLENSVDVTIEIFTVKELQYNITKHRFVPKHIRLSEEESKEFKKKYGTKFPVLLRTEPVSKFYNFKRGDIIKIIRNENGTNYVCHRIVKG